MSVAPTEMNEYTLASEETLVKSIPSRGNKPIFNALWQETEKRSLFLEQRAQQGSIEYKTGKVERHSRMCLSKAWEVN